MKQRSRVLGLLCLLLVITYLDRVCISVSGPRMQEALSISPVAWGWVTGAFTLAYAAFEIPSGTLGDRVGPRLVLTRIVLWWSSFTALTGWVSSYYPLILVRFLFGMGEAGAFPNASIAVSRWFPVPERGRAFGLMLMSSQLGGVLAPLLVVPIQAAYGNLKRLKAIAIDVGERDRLMAGARDLVRILENNGVALTGYEVVKKSGPGSPPLPSGFVSG